MYTPTNWLEHSMTQLAKTDALTNLEKIYDEAYSYIGAISHSERYYTKAECNAKYITTSNDGSGSGVICETLDSYTAQQIIDGGTPSGAIVIWSGSEGSIPSGWYLCNGVHGTPNLRSRFVIATGPNYAKGTTGGASTKVLTSASLSVGTHALTAAELPEHTHTYSDDYRGLYAGSYGVLSHYGTTIDHDSSTTLGTSTAHGHAGSTFTGSDTDVRPPFYALCYIMKS